MKLSQEVSYMKIKVKPISEEDAQLGIKPPSSLEVDTHVIHSCSLQ